MDMLTTANGRGGKVPTNSGTGCNDCAERWKWMQRLQEEARARWHFSVTVLRITVKRPQESCFFFKKIKKFVSRAPRSLPAAPSLRLLEKANTLVMMLAFFPLPSSIDPVTLLLMLLLRRAARSTAPVLMHSFSASPPLQPAPHPRSCVGAVVFAREDQGRGWDRRVKRMCYH